MLLSAFKSAVKDWIILNDSFRVAKFNNGEAINGEREREQNKQKKKERKKNKKQWLTFFQKLTVSLISCLKVK